MYISYPPGVRAGITNKTAQNGYLDFCDAHRDILPPSLVT